MSAPGTGTSTFTVTLAAAGAAGSQITFTHDVGHKALDVSVADAVTGKNLDAPTEVSITQPTVDTIIIANQSAAPVTVNVFAVFRVLSLADNHLKATDSRLSLGVGPPGPPGGSISGAGAAGQVTFWTGAASISGDNNLFWDNVTKRLGVLTTTPTEAVVDIRGVAASGTRYLEVGPPRSAFSLQIRTDIFDLQPSNMFTGIDIPATGSGVGPLNIVHEVTVARADAVLAASPVMATSNAVGIVGTAFAVGAFHYHIGAGTVSFSAGLSGAVYNANAGTITDANGVVGGVNNLGLGTITEANALRAVANTNTGGGTVGRSNGVKIDNQTGVAGVATENFQIRSEGTPFCVRSDGFVGIGSFAPAAALDLAAGSFATRAVTPATFGVTQNNYALGVGAFFRLAATAGALLITGFTGGLDGRRMTIANVGGNAFSLANANGGSAAANQILTGTGADVSVPVNGVRDLIYDATTAVWRLIT